MGTNEAREEIKSIEEQMIDCVLHYKSVVNDPDEVNEDDAEYFFQAGYKAALKQLVGEMAGHLMDQGAAKQVRQLKVYKKVIAPILKESTKFTKDWERR